MRRRLALGTVLTLLLVLALASGLVGTGALLSDTETSNGNTFTAGTLDLAVDGNNGANTVKITVGNIAPGFQRIATWKLDNLGSLPGYIDLEGITVTSYENDCIEPEIEAGDIAGDPEGELEDVLGLDAFIDEAPSNGWFGAEDIKFHSGKVAGVANNYDLNLAIPAGGTKYITAQFNWWSTADDNKAMGDSFTLDITFELAQKASQ